MARADDAAPVDILGRSDSPTQFRLKVLGRTAAGRGNVHLEYEVKPAGVPFDGSGVVSGFGLDTGVPGANGSAVALGVLVSGLSPGDLYHWRVRLVSRSPFFPRTPWLWSPYNAVTEADLRTPAVTAVAAVAAGEAPLLRSLLSPSTPNPFSGATELAYVLPEKGKVRLAVYDVAGRQVALLVDARSSRCFSSRRTQAPARWLQPFRSGQS